MSAAVRARWWPPCAGAGAGAGSRRSFGIELDRGPIRETLKPEAAPYVTLYDGRMPSPFDDGSFDAVVCSEVLEHIPDYGAAVAEMARLTRDRLVITVPDAAAIPLGTRHQLVPWHLLEATHVNFFNQRSLHALLAPHFGRINSGRISPCTMNDTPFYISLVAVCRK
ncbi:methyltransferase domain-containing protein [Azospirillum sp. RWY-5-1]|uniref:Methyltransferase domain-containing protein n=1 Tax=Azospirillum oleiclasticum TaxID=2735135 RepID=A0ABX2TDF1_9PROT|nr:methyltransferase domain-containing protein [Azospirillum oleiclasticum]NYZ22350.1 methyltransferase domain-containing protein [Azospirillum oleiclasticum]